jgi:hypothetical protein
MPGGFPFSAQGREERQDLDNHFSRTDSGIQLAHGQAAPFRKQSQALSVARMQGQIWIAWGGSPRKN